MKCVCGYEHTGGVDENGKYKDHLVGDKVFAKIEGSTFKRYLGMGETEEIYLYACPKCGTIKTVF